MDANQVLQETLKKKRLKSSSSLTGERSSRGEGEENISKDRNNRVYLYRFMLDDDTFVYKVGVSCHDNMVDRLLEISRGFFIEYRYIPMCDCRKYVSVDNAYQIEKDIHNRLSDLGMVYKFDKKFSGSSEFFIGEYDDILEVFIRCVSYGPLPDWM